MKQYKYILEPYKGPASRYRCPGCNQPRQFTRYVDAETLEPLADAVGICNRSNRCGYHYTPKQCFADNPTTGNWQPKQFRRPNYQAVPMPPVDFLPAEWIVRSCKNYEHNNLYQAFCRWIGTDAANYVFSRYRVGTANHWPGSTAFWQIDREGRARQCKVMLYDTKTGKRVKDGSDKVYFAGKTILNNYAANLQQCFFGEHLLKDAPELPVAIVESEKTALYCSIKFPMLIWLATGGKQGCRWTEKEVCKVLEGRTIVLFPDLKATELWKQKAQTIAEKIKCRIHVSEDLEARATDGEKEQGLDLMDYLLQQNTPPDKQPQKPNSVQFLEPIKIASKFSYIIKKEATGHQKWQVDDLERQAINLNALTPMRLDACTTIFDSEKFIESHIAVIRNYNGTKAGQPYFERLQKFITYNPKQYDTE